VDLVDLVQNREGSSTDEYLRIRIIFEGIVSTRFFATEAIVSGILTQVGDGTSLDGIDQAKVAGRQDRSRDCEEEEDGEDEEVDVEGDGETPEAGETREEDDEEEESENDDIFEEEEELNGSDVAKETRESFGDSLNVARITGESTLNALFDSVANHESEASSRTEDAYSENGNESGNGLKVVIDEQTKVQILEGDEQAANFDDSEDDFGDEEDDSDVTDGGSVTSGGNVTTSTDGEVSINTSKVDRSTIVRSSSAKKKQRKREREESRVPTFFPFPETPTPKKVRFSEMHEYK